MYALHYVIGVVAIHHHSSIIVLQIYRDQNNERWYTATNTPRTCSIGWILLQSYYFYVTYYNTDADSIRFWLMRKK